MSSPDVQHGRPRPAAPSPADQARLERNRKIVMIGGCIAVAAIIAAAVFWYSGSSRSGTASSGKGYGPVPARIVSLTNAPPKTVSTSAAGQRGPRALVIGKPTAEFKVVVYEDFVCPHCYAFEEASRDFLHAAAAAGRVEVEYRPLHHLPEKSSLDALNAFGAALRTAQPAAVLRFHDLLFDKQPQMAASAPDADELGAWAKSAGADAAAVAKAVTAHGKAYANAAGAIAGTAKTPGVLPIYVNGAVLDGATAVQMADNLQAMVGAS